MNKKIVFVSGSPREGNIDYILSKLHRLVECDKEIIFIREKNIKHCMGCLNCYEKKSCLIDDDMMGVVETISKADVLVIGSPNYFDNVPGILKTFIDRTASCLNKNILKNKKVIFIITGRSGVEKSRLVATQALRNFAESHGLKEGKTFCFKFSNVIASSDAACKEEIKEMAKELNKE